MEYTIASAGLAALEAKNWDEAVLKLSQALKITRSPKWLIARSKAYIGSGEFSRALRDADYAYVAAASRGNRDLVREAQHRRAVAYFRLGEYANADTCARWAQGIVEGKKTSDPEFKNPVVDERGYATATRTHVEAAMRLHGERKANDGTVMEKSPAGLNAALALRLQILGQLDKIPADDEKRKVTVKFAPEVSMDDFAAGEEIAAAKKVDKIDQDDKKEIKAAAAESVRNPSVQTDVRVDFFQSNVTVSVSVFAKGVPKDDFKVDYGENELRMSHIPGHEPWFTIPLWGAIDPAGSKHTITANKVEFQLKKAQAVKWPTLRRDPSAAPTKAPEPAAAPAAAPAASAQATTAGPSYPTSSKSGPKNWDTVLADEKDEEENDINHFFKMLYKGATPEQQRAMMKSFTESNGTALSTDWGDVKDRTVETQPPTGLEAKKWNS